MADLSELAEMTHEDPELVPEIMPVDARLAVRAPTERLQALFSRAAAVTPTKEVIPGTSFALLEAVAASRTATAHIRVTASDGDQTVSVVADGVTVLMEGRVLLPAKRMSEIVKLAPTDTVKIEVLGTHAKVTSGRAVWVVQVPVHDELSGLLDVSGIETHPVRAEALERALSVVLRSTQRTSARPALTQVLIRSGEISGCDGGRIHRQRVEGLSDAIDVTVPIKTVEETVRALKGCEDEFVAMGYDETHVVWEIGGDLIVSQRLLVPFPDIENLLLGPAFSNTNVLGVDRRELADAIKRVRINANPDSAAISLTVQPGRKDREGGQEWRLLVSARDALGNGSQEALECSWRGAVRPTELHFNHHYLSDLLDVYDVETAHIKVGDDSKTQRLPLYVEDHDLGLTAIVQQMHSPR